MRGTIYIYQHDGAPPHNRRDISAFLDANFNIWTGNKANRNRGQILWPARSADLTPLDFWLWGTLKNEIYSVPSNILQEFTDRIPAAVNGITEQQLQNMHENFCTRLRLCTENNGGHFEQYTQRYNLLHFIWVCT